MRREAPRRAGRRVLAAALLGGLGLAGESSCASHQERTHLPAPAVREPQWQDVFDPTPEFLLVIRPRALEQDPVYGPLLRRVVDLARERTRWVDATRTLDAIEDADEVVAGVHDHAAKANGADDLALVIRGVRADLDPARLVDDNGRPLWTPGPGGRVRELLLIPGPANPSDVSLFELPGRTWVVATAETRDHARDAFAAPVSLASPSRAAPRSPLDSPGDDTYLDTESPAFARLNGPSLVARVQALRAPSTLAPVGHGLAVLTVALSPGSEAVIRATFAYENEGAVGPAEATLRRTIEALSTAKPRGYEWLAGATIETAKRSVVVTAPLPRDVVGALLLPRPAPDAKTSR